jgi:hypothetical protein
MRLRTFTGVYPCIWPLTSLLADPSLPCTLEFTHSHSSVTKRLHLRVFQLHHPSLSETTLRNIFGGSASLAAEFPPASVDFFLESIYFAPPSLKRDPTLLAHAMTLAALLGFYPLTLDGNPDESSSDASISDFYYGMHNIFFGQKQRPTQTISHLATALQDLSALSGDFLCIHLAEIIHKTRQTQDLYPEKPILLEETEIEATLQKLPSIHADRVRELLRSRDYASHRIFQPPKHVNQYRGAKQRLAKMASEIVWSPSSEPTLPNDFTIAIEGQEKVLHVELWLVCTHWPYIKRLMDSGLQESLQRRLELPSSFPPDLILESIRFIYSSDPRCISFTTMEQNSEFLQSGDGAQFGFLDTEASPIFMSLLEKSLVLPDSPISPP